MYTQPPTRLGSVSSLTRVPSLPVIAEDEEARGLPKPLPPAPLRIPPKSPRRNLNLNLNRGLPPPYVPRAPSSWHPPPSYKASWTKLEERETQLRLMGDGGRRWYQDRRRWCCVLVVAALVTVVMTVALAVGLVVGMRNNKSNSNDNAEQAAMAFPAGSYAFNTTLLNSTTACTSNAATWRCYPYVEGSSASFFWIITAVNASSYTISSTDNPFAPSFTNLTLSFLDENQSTERLTFSFAMDKTVVPSEQLTASNRAATCTFDATRFEATLWTRRAGEAAVDGSRFGAWPGDVEVVQSKSGASGSPSCKDSDGKEIGDVEAGKGDCECRYASFDDK
ncbi:hypothetical protein G7046_g2201 [Stylonectria norvegica]|nr:hypothetical protein G7046_g2201 [Stylonectria norvegica]